MSKQLLKLILAVTGICLFWSLVTPTFEFPDEQAHFGSVEFLVKTHRMPRGEELDMTHEMAETQKILGVFRNGAGQNQFTYHPEYTLPYTGSLVGESEPLIIALNNDLSRTTLVATEAARYPRSYYDYASFWDRLVWTSDILTRLFVTRLGNTLLVIPLGWIVYQTGLLLFRQPRFAALLTLMVFLQPMFSFVTSGVNSDNLHNLLFSIIIYLCLKIMEPKPSLSTILSLAVVMALDIYTKPQGIIALPIVLIALFISLIKHRSYNHLWWFVFVGSLSLPLVFTALKPYLGLVFAQNITGADSIEFLRFSVNKLLAQNIVWYWGVFKWLGVVLPPIYWQLANRIVLIAGIGIVIYFVKYAKYGRSVGKSTALSQVIFAILSVVIYLGAIYWYDWQYSKIIGYSIGVQARYFFPTIVLQMYLLIHGLTSLGWSKRSTLYLARFLGLFFIYLQLGGLMRLITIYYDTTSLATLITQLSQYKPFFAKGEWWYLWFTLYAGSLLYLIRSAMKGRDD